MNNYDLYNFEQPFAAFPSKCRGIYVTDAVYLNEGSYIEWRFPPQIKKFEASYMALDGSSEAIGPVNINGQVFEPGWFACVDIPEQKLVIQTGAGNKAFGALVSPKLHFLVDRPSTIFE